MTQQEIFQNMDKYERQPLPLNSRTPRYKANKFAEASAINNTYLKGINPESVERLKELLELIATNYADMLSEPMYNKIEEALTAAKL